MAITDHILINHGSTNSWVELFMAGNVYNWQVQHNVLPYHQHSGHDEDLDAGRVIRFTRSKMV
jgi:linoleoyl-CoA desaturase